MSPPFTIAHADRGAVVAAWGATVLGLASAGVSAYWAAGGTGLLDTIGGEIERWGRERSASVVVALAAVAALKVVVAVAAVLATRTVRAPAWTAGRAPRALSWIAAIVLTVYGGILTAAGVLVQLDVLDASADADRRALAWHTWLWDPWFALWGLAFLLALHRTRR